MFIEVCVHNTVTHTQYHHTLIAFINVKSFAQWIYLHLTTPNWVQYRLIARSTEQNYVLTPSLATRCQNISVQREKHIFVFFPFFYLRVIFSLLSPKTLKVVGLVVVDLKSTCAKCSVCVPYYALLCAPPIQLTICNRKSKMQSELLSPFIFNA